MIGRAVETPPRFSQLCHIQQGNRNEREFLPEYRSVDGTGNNLTNPSLNADAGSVETRIAPADFAPGTSNGLIDGPNPREISNVVSGGPDAETSDPNDYSAWMYVWGQFIDHDLDHTATDNVNSIDISIPPGDPDLAGDTIPLTRFVTDPSTGTAVNDITGWIDGSQIYGSDAATAASLRNPNGTLKTSAGDNLPIVNGAFAAGDVRASENPDLSAVTTLFVREHNFQVAQLRQEHPDWTGDQLYQQARAIVGAEIENITYTEFLPKVVGDLIPAYQGYNPSVDPRITQEFSTASNTLNEYTQKKKKKKRTEVVGGARYLFGAQWAVELDLDRCHVDQLSFGFVEEVDHQIDGSAGDDVAGGGQDGQLAVFKLAAGVHRRAGTVTSAGDRSDFWAFSVSPEVTV